MISIGVFNAVFESETVGRKHVHIQVGATCGRGQLASRPADRRAASGPGACPEQQQAQQSQLPFWESMVACHPLHHSFTRKITFHSPIPAAILFPFWRRELGSSERLSTWSRLQLQFQHRYF